MNPTYGIERPPNGLATFQAALRRHLATQGIGLRPQPWAPFSRPVGPDGLASRVLISFWSPFRAQRLIAEWFALPHPRIA
jgi:hypothetical protein